MYDEVRQNIHTYDSSRGSAIGATQSMPAQPVQHDLECLEKSVANLRETIYRLHEKLDPILIPEGPTCGSVGDKIATKSCPLSEQIMAITNSVCDLSSSVAHTLTRLAL